MKSTYIKAISCGMERFFGPGYIEGIRSGVARIGRWLRIFRAAAQARQAARQIGYTFGYVSGWPTPNHTPSYVMLAYLALGHISTTRSAC